MIPWELLDVASVPESDDELRLYRRGKEFSLRVEQSELMNSREHNSEDVLAELACDRVRDRSGARVLIGGLGMGFTLAASLPRLNKDASIVVAELIPEVVRWNYEYFGEFSGHPLGDPRVTVIDGDVGLLMQREREGFDAIMLDVDNGPDGFTRESNDALYGRKGIAIAYAALRPGGVLTVWSAKPSPAFVERLQRQHFTVEEVTPRSRNQRKGAFHTIWIATRAG